MTSALTGPSTTSHISLILIWWSAPSFAMSEGFVVTPSRMPVDAASVISSRFAVSMNIFMVSPAGRVHSPRGAAPRYGEDDAAAPKCQLGGECGLAGKRGIMRRGALNSPDLRANAVREKIFRAFI